MSSGIERRIGHRHQIALPIAISPITLTKKRWRKPKPIELTTDNLSLSGAGFICDAIPELHPHSLINVTLGGTTGPAVVRMVRPQGKGPSTYYGIEFSDPRVGDTVRDMISEHLETTVVEEPENKPVDVNPTASSSASPHAAFNDWY